MHDATWRLPDPDRQAEFYVDIPVKRLFAWIIDGFITFLITALIIPFTLFLGLLIFPVLWLIVGFAYRTITIARMSATPGMAIMAIELRTIQGLRLNFNEALLHTLAYTVSLASFILQIAAIVCILGTPRRQSLGDLILGTAAINRAAQR